jgi:hypothetical protein
MAPTRRARIRELVRHFKENGMKLMLEHPANVRDVLRLADVPWFEEIEFERIQEIKTTFIRRNYRHLQSDIVLTAPLSGSGLAERKLLIYILIEHQSEPDRLMPLRLADSYVRAMLYHERSESEQGRLQQIMENSVQDEATRQEVVKRRKTGAEALMERGAQQGAQEAGLLTRRQTLVRLLRKRFGDIPSDVVSVVEATDDVGQLDNWLDRLVTAQTLEELEIREQDE